jgi:putative flippase GtrA
MLKDSFIIQFIKFGIVGFLNTIIGYVIYSVFVYFGFHYLIGSIIAFVIGVGSAFFVNSKIVFKKGREHRNTVVAVIKYFVLYGITGIIMQNILLYIFIDGLALSKYLAPIFCLFFTVPSNFVLSKFWVFKTYMREGGTTYNEKK